MNRRDVLGLIVILVVIAVVVMIALVLWTQSLQTGEGRNFIREWIWKRATS